MEEKLDRPGYLFRRHTTNNIKKQLSRDDFGAPKMKRQLSVIKEGLRPVMSDPSSLHTRSSAVDLVARRGVFSRRHYGSVEHLGAREQDGFNSGRFRVEDGDRDEITTGTDIHLENPEYQTRWYFKYFLGKIHQNYVGSDVEKNVFFLSVVLTDANNHNVPQYRAILWRKTGTQKICIPYNPAKPMSVKRILSRFDMKIDKSPKEIFSADVQKELLLLEEQEGSVNFKFGVLYAAPKQTTDDEMFSNENGSEAFQNFISLLGDYITLKNWDKFNGGLDVKNNTTGKESIYTTYEGHEIMFHVSTMLPFSKENRQQVERKRHVGNDIATIVFQDTEDPDNEPTFKPSMIRSHFTHIFALVTHNKKDSTYKLRVFSAESVPLFGPPLPSPPVFEDFNEFRDFLLVKLINGEKAAFNTPVFAYKRQRTLDMLIKNLQQELQPEVMKQNMMNKRSLSDVISEPSWSWRNKKEDARQIDFVKTGQLLKLKTIVKGDAPTSLATTSFLRREPWEPQVLLADFPHDIICGDAWGDKLLVATEAGTFVIEEGSSPRLMFDKTVCIKQISVVEAHGLILFRADKGKEGRIYVFRLSDFEGEEQNEHVRTKADCKDHKLEKTRGCNLFAVSRPGGSHLRMVVSNGKKLSLFTWKHSAAWSAWCTAGDTDTIEGFQFVKELSAGDVPSVMTLVDGSAAGDNEICVGYKHQFDLINEKTGESKKLFHLDAQKVSFVSVLDVYEEDEPEVLLSYNHVSQFQHLNGEHSSDYDIHWNSAPTAIACAFPYIIAFTHHSVEIRLVINGNLVHTMTMPKLRVISTKCDMYFSSANQGFLQPSPREPSKSFSPMASPTSTPPGLSPSSIGVRILKVPLLSLIGQMPERAGTTPTSRVKSFISPLVNVVDSPEMKTRQPHNESDNGLVFTVDSNLPTSNGSVVTAKPQNRQFREYSDSGYEESDHSFESQESLPVMTNSPKLNGSAEARRKLFGCLKSPRQARRAVSPLASETSSKDFNSYSNSSPLGSPAMRKRIDSCHSDVFPPSPSWDSKESRGSLLSTDSDASFHDFRLPRSPLASTDSFSSNERSQTEAEMRAELFGKHPKLERLKENSISMFSQEIDEDGPSPLKPKTLVRPFALSLSMEDEDIDLK